MQTGSFSSGYKYQQKCVAIYTSEHVLPRRLSVTRVIHQLQAMRDTCPKVSLAKQTVLCLSVY